MKIYISGISGTGMGPLALMAKKAGLEVVGSDLAEGAILPELINAGIEVKIGKQDGEFLSEKLKEGIDWFAYTSALPEDHPELVMAREAGIKVSKRDDLTAFLVEKLGLKMVAVAGTHGKTTTTSMIIWTALRLGLPIAYLVGTTLGFAPSGIFHGGDKYFIYEADEYDRNFLKYHPWLAVIAYVSYDHPDIYPTRGSYKRAFWQFERQSEKVIGKTGKGYKSHNIDVDEFWFITSDFDLAGELRREDAVLAANAVMEIIKDASSNEITKEELQIYKKKIIDILNEFPGVGRRFEKLADGVYSDYAHHPEEVEATVKMAIEQAKIDNKKGVVVIYEPHQNIRQHEVKDDYKKAFLGVDKVFWLPTYLTRENPDLPVITPRELIEVLENKDKAEVAELSDELWSKIKELIDQGYLILLMTAGPADSWLRKSLKK